MTHVVLLNAGAGSAKGDVADVVRRRFAQRGVPADVRVIGSGEDPRRAAARAAAERPQAIVAGGGDGTLNAVAEAVVGRSIAFGVLPLGTLNHFAKDLRIPLELEAAVDVACGGRTQDVDVGRVNGRVFLNNSSLGLYPQAVREREQLTERLGHAKWPAYAWAAMSVVRRFPFVDARIVVDGEERFYRTPLVFVGNNSYELDAMNLGGRQCLDAGHLWVHVVKRTTRWGLVLLAARALVGRLQEAEDFVTFCVTDLTVRTHRPSIMVATDGEVARLDTPLQYEVQPRALRVLVPGA